ncbi:uncharacterized protein SPPG_00061 [Spizellomyces punctatus DAOM BR117]|uniref:Peptidase A1 domain-containing protein n=1 Tax=Spizellomyces punctatus (strain DAOM BR117) TaxID=645134 RepID=A0A0L0HSJ0_SPIPD|nr:uncharacterized protein SPPG_00061 [Spizellomyces punctatus DAOM BR117]KND04331.1 hypothetical protein SPPG_00061 [Spizellomyces punctatus DAOM BR117]|eukprot:XP_016612370.1 hypothetical protein SPPG_00061 [Spizellomyces punctatus DAOM BR117]
MQFKALALLLVAAAPAVFAAPAPAANVKINSDLRVNPDGWTPIYADYIGHMKSRFVNKPVTVAQASQANTKTGYYIEGNNNSDDLFMGIMRQVTGLVPNQLYKMDWNINMTSPFGDNCFGVGGSPGGSNYVKIGGATNKPNVGQKRTASGDFWTFTNFDHGHQADDGKDMSTVSNISVPGAECEGTEYGLVPTILDLRRRPVKADANGSLWAVIGIDSGFEGVTGVYYQQIAIEFIPATAEEAEFPF